jgi:hypothetical protein
MAAGQLDSPRVDTMVTLTLPVNSSETTVDQDLQLKRVLERQLRIMLVHL